MNTGSADIDGILARCEAADAELWRDWRADYERGSGTAPTFTARDFGEAAVRVTVKSMHLKAPSAPEAWERLIASTVFVNFVEIHGWDVLHMAEAIAHGRRVATSAIGEVSDARN